MNSGNASDRTAMLVIVTFAGDLLEHFNPSSWQEFVGQLARRAMVPITWQKSKRPAPIGVMFDFRHLQMPHAKLPGIDLTYCDLEGANFDGACMMDARLGSCGGASFRHSRLNGSAFRGDISGCDFTGSDITAADFSHAYYSEPPTGLPAEVLAQCEVLADESDEPAGWPPTVIENTLQVRATITEVPW